MKRVYSWIRRISHIGVDETLSEDLARKIRITNAAALFMAVMMFLVGAVSLPFREEYRELNLVRMVLGVIYSLPLLLNHLKRYNSARFYTIISPSLALTAIASVIGAAPATSLKIALMPAVLLPVVLFGVTEIRKMLTGLALVIPTIALLDLIAETVSLKPGIAADIFSNSTEININIIISILLFIVAVIIYQTVLKQTEESLREEHIRAENLLKNILPEEVIPILKESPDVIAQHFENTSILFADIVNFTPLSMRKTPGEIVSILNTVFSQFDTVVEKFGVEKIKTIGDCYMVAAGVPRTDPEHAKRLVETALAFRDYISSTSFDGETLGLRIGIASGPVVAGVIGKKKFIYDLWGDTVNTASRMESHGAIGEIQITEETKELIESEFKCRKVTDITVKGKGVMPIYIVEGKKSEMK